jgi:hypothetical protein
MRNICFNSISVTFQIKTFLIMIYSFILLFFRFIRKMRNRRQSKLFLLWFSNIQYGLVIFQRSVILILHNLHMLLIRFFPYLDVNHFLLLFFQFDKRQSPFNRRIVQQFLRKLIFLFSNELENAADRLCFVICCC